MSVSLAAEIWNLVRDALPEEDVEQLADGLVGILVDSGFDLDDIRYEFSGDSEVETAIKWYADDVETDVEDADDYGDGGDEDSNW